MNAMKCSIQILLFAMLWVVLHSSCQQATSDTAHQTGPADDPLFELVPAGSSGIDFRNELIEDVATNYNVLSYEYYFNGGGVAVGDINNDGLPDLCFTGNTSPNKLYLNKGNFRFEDVTERAGINPPNKHWSTGAVFVDINDDGWQDLYICQAGPEENPELRRNLLFINNGDGTFREEAARWGLDDGNRSVQAAFFDYDKDGDLDCFVMNHSKYFRVILAKVFKDLERKEALEEASSNLFRNDGGHFTRVTEEAGLLRYGYGLGLVVNDIDGDGWTDIYQANDYSVPDFMWINNGDGTFTDRVKQMTHQISFYGMGCDVADYDNDALPDIVVVDMAADDHFRDKTLMASMDTKGFWYFVNTRGYQYAYMFNSLQHNNGNGTFSNLASLADVLRTDWSWAALFADFDLDGWKDLFVSNGYRRYARDNDFRNLLAQKREQYGGTIPLEHRAELYEQMPEIMLPNVMFHNNGDLTFEKVQSTWGTGQPSFSNGAAWADLDNDGDLDLVVNNLDQDAFVYRNRAVEKKKGHFLTIRFEGKPATVLNTKVTIHAGPVTQYWEYHPVRGFQSNVGQEVHFGLGAHTTVDLIEIEWPDGKYSRMENVAADQILNLKRGQLPEGPKPARKPEPTAFEPVNPATLGIDFRHAENFFDDFTVQVLLPHKQSTLGPRLATADVNGDGLEDFFIGGA
ncbi:MAG: CRTAC1 family protein, partial [Bacteroidetes bacterium]